jgi:hypothetical protein
MGSKRPVTALSSLDVYVRKEFNDEANEGLTSRQYAESLRTALTPDGQEVYSLSEVQHFSAPQRFILLPMFPCIKGFFMHIGCIISSGNSLFNSVRRYLKFSKSGAPPPRRLSAPRTVSFCAKYGLFVHTRNFAFYWL